MFAFDDEMLDLANQLALTKVAQKPFDHAISGLVIVQVAIVVRPPNVPMDSGTVDWLALRVD
jgi:hypothetical protein